jgi:heterodisulfide reductase subunit C
LKEDDTDIIDVNDLDGRFSRNIMRQTGGEALQKCFQCGNCVADCPIRAIDVGFNPRKIIKKAMLGMKSEVFKDKFTWLCSVCFICQERCPQDVRPPEVMNAIKNIAVKEGFIIQPLKKLLTVFEESGRLYPVDEFIAEERETLGLPKIIEKSEFGKKLLEKKR